MATHSSVLAWKIPRTEELKGATVHGAAESGMTQHEHMPMYTDTHTHRHTHTHTHRVCTSSSTKKVGEQREVYVTCS